MTAKRKTVVERRKGTRFQIPNSSELQWTNQPSPTPQEKQINASRTKQELSNEQDLDHQLLNKQRGRQAEKSQKRSLSRSMSPKTRQALKDQPNRIPYFSNKQHTNRRISKNKKGSKAVGVATYRHQLFRKGDQATEIDGAREMDLKTKGTLPRSGSGGRGAHL